jgi:uncharacterized protein
MNTRHIPAAPATLPPEAVIGMIHVQALPGAPRSALPVDAIVEQAVAETRILVDAGFDALIVENMHDRPYVHGRHGPETVAAMTRVVAAAREIARRDGDDLPLGVQMLSGGNREALAVALATGAQFIRCENFVFAHVADEGLLAEAEAGPLLRYRRQIGAEHIRVLTDVKKKHAVHAITADLTLTDAAEAAEFFGSDGIIVSGTATGKPTREEDVIAAASATSLPVYVGSGVTVNTISSLLRHSAGVIVGSAIKRDGLWSNPPDPERCRAIVAAARSANG